MEYQGTTPDSDPPPFLKLYKAGFKKDLFALGLIVLTLAIFRYRAFQNFNSLVLGGVEGDAGLYVWLLQSAAKSLFTLPWFSTSAFYPYGLTLAWSDNFLLPSFLAWPFLAMKISLPAVFNSIIILAALLNGFLAYRLAYALYGSFQAALFAALVFPNSMFVTGHLGHPQLQFAFFFPLVTLLYFRFIEKPSLFRAVCIGIAGTAAFVCSVYYAIFSALCVFVLLLATILLRPHYLKTQQYFFLFFGGCLGAAPALPFVRPYMRIGNAFGERALHEAYYFSANLASFFSAPAWSRLYYFSSSWSHAEANLFPGFVVYVLSAAAISRLFQAKTQREVYRALGATIVVLCISFLPGLQLASSHYIGSAGLWFLLLSFAWLIHAMGNLERQLGAGYFTNRAIIASFALMAVLAFSLSFGPLGFPEAGDVSISPYRFFYAFFPGFSSLRAIGRIGVLFQFALIMLSSAALAHFTLKHAKLGFLAVLAILLALFENNPSTYPLQLLPHKPAVFDSLKDIAGKEDAVIVLPMTQELDKNNRVKSWSNFATLNVNSLQWSLGSAYNLVNGYSGLRSKLMKELPGKTFGFPDLRAIETLKQIAGLRFVVYLPSLVPGFDRKAFETKLSEFPGLELLSRDLEGNYLIKLGHACELKEDYWLLAPAYKNGNLDLQLMTPRDNSTAAKIRITELGGSIPLQEISVPADGAWRSYSIALEATRDSVIPWALHLEIEGAKKIYLGECVFERS